MAVDEQDRLEQLEEKLNQSLKNQEQILNKEVDISVKPPDLAERVLTGLENGAVGIVLLCVAIVFFGRKAITNYFDKAIATFDSIQKIAADNEKRYKFFTDFIERQDETLTVMSRKMSRLERLFDDEHNDDPNHHTRDNPRDG